MFKLLKKKKLQKHENEKTNKNVEKNADISTSTESVFPSANESLEISKQKWKQVSAEEILKKIKEESSRGGRFVKFYNSCISDELVKELENQGYKLEVYASPAFIGPYFEISW